MQARPVLETETIEPVPAVSPLLDQVGPSSGGHQRVQELVIQLIADARLFAQQQTNSHRWPVEVFLGEDADEATQDWVVKQVLHLGGLVRIRGEHTSALHVRELEPVIADHDLVRRDPLCPCISSALRNDSSNALDLAAVNLDVLPICAPRRPCLGRPEPSATVPVSNGVAGPVAAGLHPRVRRVHGDGPVARRTQGGEPALTLVSALLVC
eukprot:569706-Rhodomonas_salina.1